MSCVIKENKLLLPQGSLTWIPGGKKKKKNSSKEQRPEAGMNIKFWVTKRLEWLEHRDGEGREGGKKKQGMGVIQDKTRSNTGSGSPECCKPH